MLTGKESQSTCFVRLFEDPDYFAIRYYERIWRAFLARCRNQAQADDLTQQFFERKVLEGGLLNKFQRSLEEIRSEAGPSGVSDSSLPSFRKYLYRSVDNFFVEQYRKAKRNDPPNIDLRENDRLVVAEPRNLDPDALYALSVLHRAIQAVRNHFRKKNKPTHWEIFESLVLSEYLTGKSPGNLEQLRLQYFPMSRDNQDIHNCLTTVKRVFQKVLITYFESESDDAASGTELFQEWMAILKRSNASLHSALQAAYRTVDIPSTEASMALSLAMARGVHAEQEPDPKTVDTDEMAILLSFRLDLPLYEWVNGDRMMELIPKRSARSGNDLPAEIRSLSMSALIDPDEPESGRVKDVPTVEILRLIKNESKRLTKSADRTFPEHIHTLFYTLAASIAAWRYAARISTLDHDAIRKNLCWYLDQPWLDDRVRSLFREFVSVDTADR